MKWTQVVALCLVGAARVQGDAAANVTVTAEAAPDDIPTLPPPDTTTAAPVAPAADPPTPMQPPMDPVSEEELAALTPPYDTHQNVDYIPSQTPPPMIPVMDLDDGYTATSVIDCAAHCTANPECAMFSWYGNSPTWELTKNCYIKSLGTPCDLPPDVTQHTDNRYLFIQQANCDGAGAMAGNMTTTTDGAMTDGAMTDDATAMMPEDMSMAPTDAGMSTEDICEGCENWWGKCGGVRYDGPGCCAPGATCVEETAAYSQCQPENMDTSCDEMIDGCLPPYCLCGGDAAEASCCAPGTQCMEMEDGPDMMCMPACVD